MDEQITIIDYYYKMGDKTFLYRQYPDGSTTHEEVPVLIFTAPSPSHLWEK